jgi:hypothetical protein
VDGLQSNVLTRVQELTAPEERVEHVRVSDIVGVGRMLDTSEDVEEVLEQLKDRLLKALASGARVILE